ncbi:MAG: hypothetical protein RLZZ579_415 [Actinomycetota bacterium]|jgi:hypothetical protein
MCLVINILEAGKQWSCADNYPKVGGGALKARALDIANMKRVYVEALLQEATASRRGKP